MEKFKFTYLIVLIQLFISVHSIFIKETVLFEKYRNIINKESEKALEDILHTKFKAMGTKVEEPVLLWTDALSYYEKQLTEFEKKIYLGVVKMSQPPITTNKAVISSLEKFKVQESNFEKSLFRIIELIGRDLPELWWMTSYGWSFALDTNNYIKSVTITFGHTLSLSEINKYNNKTLNKALSIANAAKKQSTVYNKIKYIHDYLVKNIKYGEGLLGVYSCLLENRCVCNGYAHAFMYIARFVGIESIIVANNDHAWNYVKIGSAWYGLDATWDDPGNNNPGDDSNKHYKYFLVGSNTVVEGNSITFLKDGTHSLPKDNYFTYPTISKAKYKAS